MVEITWVGVIYKVMFIMVEESRVSRKVLYNIMLNES
jgi:hypothetical protein